LNTTISASLPNEHLIPVPSRPLELLDLVLPKVQLYSNLTKLIEKLGFGVITEVGPVVQRR
jgi:hypothetical protein